MYQKRKPTCTKICFTLPQGWWSCCMSSSDAGSFFLFFSLAWTHVFLLSDCHGLTADVIARVKQIINFPTCIQHSFFSCLHPRPTLLSPITVSCAPADSPAVFRFIFVMKHCQLSRAINYIRPCFMHHYASLCTCCALLVSHIPELEAEQKKRSYNTINIRITGDKHTWKGHTLQST